MKKIFPIIVLILLLIPFTVNAAQDQGSMRSLAVTQLYQYAQAVYDRGDYAQAATIFSRILAMDPANSAARSYAKKLNAKGQQIVIPPMPTNPVIASAPIMVTPKGVVKKIVEQPKKEATQEVTKSTYNNEDLKNDLQEADRSIGELKSQVAALRSQIAEGQKDLTQ